MLTPSTPTRASSNRVSSTHKALANVWLTARSAPQETVLSSSIRSGRPRSCAVCTSPLKLSASPLEAAGDSRCAIVG